MTPDAAVDEVYAMLKTYWDTLAGSPMKYPGTDVNLGESRIIWGECVITHGANEKQSLGDVSGKALWKREAKLIVTVSFPQENSLTNVYPVCYGLQQVFEGVRTVSGIRFTNSDIREIGVVNGWLKMNVVSSFYYEEYK